MAGDDGSELTRDGEPALESATEAVVWAWRCAGRPSAVLLAVSGGGDSMALLAASAALARETRVFVATVDHGLRPGSAAEAAAVEMAASRGGLTHRTLRWRDAAPPSGLQAAARNARYRLLAAHANEVDAGAIMTGHTANDLAETFLMRLGRGSGAAGLASMLRPRAVACGAGEPVDLLRPFLGLTRARLRSAALAAGLSVVDDPSNEDTAYERIRVRRGLRDHGPGLGLSVQGIAGSAHRLARYAAQETAAMERRATGASAFATATSMPVATTDTRSVPSMLVSRVEPTMIFASGSTFSRMMLAASSNSNSVRS